MTIRWDIAEGIRADIFTWAAINLQGKRGGVRVFPQGARRGDLHTDEVRSMVIMAPYGTRVILKTSASDSWQQHPWRCIHISKDAAVPAARRTGLPGVRIPDLDLLSAFDAKRIDRDFEESFPMVEQLTQGHGWTFGRGAGEIKGRVRAIQLDKMAPGNEHRAPPLSLSMPKAPFDDRPVVPGTERVEPTTSSSSVTALREITVFHALPDEIDAVRIALTHATERARGASGVRFAELWANKERPAQLTWIVDFDNPDSRQDLDRSWLDSLQEALARPPATIALNRLD